MKSSEHAKEASRQATEAYGAYITSVNELATHARAKSQELWQAFMQAGRAAAVGDDAFVRTAAAFQDFQREYTKLESEYVRAVSESYSTLASSATAADANVRAKMLDDYIAYLQGLRREMTPDSSTNAQSARG